MRPVELLPKALWVLMAATLLGATPAAANPESLDLPNGLRWIHKRIRHNRIVAIRLFFPSATMQEPPEKAGLTTLMTSLLFKGAAGFNALQIAQAVESLGGSVELSNEEDYWELNGQVTVDRFPSFLRILREVLFRATFPPQEFEKEKQALLNGIRSKQEDIFTVTYETFGRTMYGNHSYGRPPEGTLETVSSLQREDVVAWHRKVLRPDGAVLVTVGPISRSKMKKLVLAAFGDWKKLEGLLRKQTKPDRPAKGRATSAKLPFEQSFVMTGYPAPGVKDPDYPAMKILNAYLGSGMSSPLFQKVREEGSLAYEVSAFLPTRSLGSSLILYAGTGPGRLEEVEKRMKEVIAEIRANPPDETALRRTKKHLRGLYRMDRQTNSRLAWFLGWWEILGKGFDYVEGYVDDFEKVSPGDFRRALERIFSGPAVTVRINPGPAVPESK